MRFGLSGIPIDHLNNTSFVNNNRGIRIGTNVSVMNEFVRYFADMISRNTGSFLCSFRIS